MPFDRQLYRENNWDRIKATNRANYLANRDAYKERATRHLAR